MHYHIKRSALIIAKSSAVDASRARSEVPSKPKAFERGRFNDKAARTETDKGEKRFSYFGLKGHLGPPLKT